MSSSSALSVYLEFHHLTYFGRLSLNQELREQTTNQDKMEDKFLITKCKEAMDMFNNLGMAMGKKGKDST